MLHHEGAATVVEEPSDFDLALKRPVGDTVGFQVVALGIVHRNQKIGGLGAERDRKKQDDKYVPKAHTDIITAEGGNYYKESNILYYNIFDVMELLL